MKFKYADMLLSIWLKSSWLECCPPQPTSCWALRGSLWCCYWWGSTSSSPPSPGYPSSGWLSGGSSEHFLDCINFDMKNTISLSVRQLLSGYWKIQVVWDGLLPTCETKLNKYGFVQELRTTQLFQFPLVLKQKPGHTYLVWLSFVLVQFCSGGMSLVWFETVWKFGLVYTHKLQLVQSYKY